MNKLAYCVQQSGYTFTHGNNVIVQELEGGPSRYRRSRKRNSHIVSVNFTVKKEGYDYLVAFFNVWAMNPAMPFLAMLIIDDAELAEYKCAFRSEFHLDSKDGPIFKVSTTFEVQAKLRNIDNDLLLVLLGNNHLLDRYTNIEKIPNIWLPNAVGV